MNLRDDDLILFFGSDERSREICQRIMRAGIPCRFIASSEELVPVLYYGIHKYDGDDLDRFLNRLEEMYKKEK